MAGDVGRSLPARASHVGVDGASDGWLCAALHDGGWSFELFERFADVRTRLEDPERVLVDVPIGVPERGRRACDVRASRLLGPRSSSVFYAPTRAALDVREAVRDGAFDGADPRSVASDRNDERGAGGLSIQAWHITDLILAVDDALDGAPPHGPYLEAHPELAFAAANGAPVAHSKHDEPGVRRRRALLDERFDDGEHTPALDAAREAFYRYEASTDDLLDAMALALAARGPLRSVPEKPENGQARIYYPAVETFPPAESDL